MFSPTVPTPNNRGRTTNISSTAVKAMAICWDVDRTILRDRDKDSRKQTRKEPTTVPRLYNPINRWDAQTMRLQTAVSAPPPQTGRTTGCPGKEFQNKLNRNTEGRKKTVSVTLPLLHLPFVYSSKYFKS